jgi:hypothetical protein
MEFLLQSPFEEQRTFKQALNNEKTLAVFVRHPG